MEWYAFSFPTPAMSFDGGSSLHCSLPLLPEYNRFRSGLERFLDGATPPSSGPRLNAVLEVRRVEAKREEAVAEDVMGDDIKSSTTGGWKLPGG